MAALRSQAAVAKAGQSVLLLEEAEEVSLNTEEVSLNIVEA